jgi:hypothetical protein
MSQDAAEHNNSAALLWINLFILHRSTSDTPKFGFRVKKSTLPFPTATTHVQLTWYPKLRPVLRKG